ncbi:hypothetical protein DTO166G4_6286 [Paecilomyces variotii]|nr:hypothetical protein DTO032I3_6654 [Paecilomyces variotii]KAJ9212130.1 hypothetical protein DTO166G4_6286 [Paecilomyces variotii]KAJ9219885.1 hypothetical protein DTO169C6_7760 [Paecilomyces variotii]KAJ9236096.1 hypothetical protein DTO169E5_5919 [Paecilomyces variotii]KAJ9239947.1 hypothetical protein DTO166G5_2214 [Paecilomyces variotii]
MISYILLGLAATQGTHAWGVLGHATVAYIAQNYVNSEVASWAQGVLSNTNDSYLADIASWADEYRLTSAGAWSAPLHYIDAQDNPPSSCNVDYNRDCGSSGCSVSAIANYTQRVGDGRLSSEHTAEALKFIVHFVGDITQPLHDEAYEVGGNEIKVTYQGYSDNLHADWDTYMPETLIGGSSLSDAKTWADQLIKEIDSGDYASQKASWIDGDDVKDAQTTATRWASDGNSHVCTVVMPNGAAALEKGDLYPTYYNSAISTIELQIAKGGYRLANWLNMVYTSEIASKKRATIAERREESVELSPRDLSPEPRQLSKVQLARAAMGGSCGCEKHR